jgi:hypothetical protein
MPTFATNSKRWAIFDAVATALETDPAMQGVAVERNPSDNLRVDAGQYRLVVRWSGDTLTATKGQREQRRFRLIVGSIANTGASSDRDADAMHEAAAALIRRIWPTLSDIAANLRPTEQELTPDVEDKRFEGALVLSGWDIDYERPIVWPGQQ